MVISFTDVLALQSKILILTGTRGTGKTTTCQAWIEQAVKQGWNVAGLICPAVFEGGSKTGINAKNLSTGEVRRLANLANGEIAVVATDHWNFNSPVLQWGSKILGEISQCDLFVMDELGPLEFYRQQGWVEAFTVLRTAEYRQAIVVIRPELLDEALKKWPDAAIYSLEKIIRS
jgi:nucleoside-triphosphatase THEP1